MPLPKSLSPKTQVQDSQDVLQDVKNLPGFHLRTEVSHFSVNMTLSVVFLRKESGPVARSLPGPLFIAA